MNTVVLIDNDGSQIWHDGREFPWAGMGPLTCNIVTRYGEFGRRPLEIHYPPSHAEHNITLDADMSDLDLQEWAVCWLRAAERMQK